MVVDRGEMLSLVRANIKMIHFNVPPFTGKKFDYMREVIDNQKICGDGSFTKRCNAWIEERFGEKKALFTTNGSTALDMAALYFLYYVTYHQDIKIIILF